MRNIKHIQESGKNEILCEDSIEQTKEEEDIEKTKIKSERERENKYENYSITQSNANANQDTEAKYDNLSRVNKDIRGWIKINGTCIDYPILFTSDNNYYLTRNYEKEPSAEGSIFLDSKLFGMGDFLVLHGHNMDNGTMFHDLMKFRNKSFLDKYCSEITIYNGNENKQYSVFSVFEVDNNFELKTNFPTKEDKLEYLKVLSSQSMYSDLTFDYESESILIMNTCCNIGEKHLIICAYNI